MSHFTKLDKANITNAAAFEKACCELGYTDIKRNAQMRGWMSNTQRADVVACKPGSRYDVGIVKNGNKYDLVADWWGVEQQTQGAQGAFLRLTTKHTVIDTYRRQGFVAQVKEDQAHNITITLTR